MTGDAQDPQTPDLAGLLVGASLAARAMRQPVPDEAALRELLHHLLFKPQAERGKALWPCFAMGLITRYELRCMVLSHFATWISRRNGVTEPSAETWCTPELEGTFDAALFGPRAMPVPAGSLEALSATVDAMAAARSDGAVLHLEAGDPSMKKLRVVVSEENCDAILLDAARTAARELGVTTWARTGWSSFEFVLPGSRDALADAVTRMVLRLRADHDCRMLAWRAILTRVFPGEALRTLWCDPGYALQPLKGSAVVWVDPYPGDDWQEVARYPTTSVIWSDP